MQAAPAAQRLNQFLSLLSDASRARFLGARSFVHELEAKHAQQASGGGGYTRLDADGTLAFEYLVPERVCRPDGRLQLSAILAIVDETTSWASVATDRHKRPGVSIALHAALEPGRRPPRAGQRLVFKSRSERMGRTLGFQTCTVQDEAGGLVATARHTKLLDMGRGWALAMGPVAFPCTRFLMHAAGGFVDRPPPELSPSLGHLLAPEEARVVATPWDVARGGDGGNLYGFTAEAVSRHTVTPPMLNEVRILFGGFQALLHEEAGARATVAAVDAAAEAAGGARGSGVDLGLVLTNLDVTYLASAKRHDVLEVRARASAVHGAVARAGAPSGGAGIVATSCLSRTGTRGGDAAGLGLQAGRGVLCSEARMHFALSSDVT